MNRKIHHILALAIAALLTACTDQEVHPDGPTDLSGKTPIELSVGGVDAPAMTRAVVTDGENKTMQNFDNNTKIFMIMKSEYSALSSPYDDLNFGGSQITKYTVSRGDVTANTNKVVFDATNQKYWDDAHARSTKLSIWAYAQKGMSWTTCSFGEDKQGGGYQTINPDLQTSSSIAWRTAPIYPMIFNWKASHLTGAELNKQNATTVMCQDLIFSNNLADNTTYSKPDGRLAFNPATRKFPTEGNAHMYFYHAMSKITIKIIEGEGFNTSSTTDFQFKTGTNVKLTGFNTEGLFSIQMGGFQQINNHADIPSIYLKTTNTSTAPYYTLEALAVPNIDEFTQTYEPAQNDDYSRFVKDKKDYATDVMMEFTIDDNTYQVTSGQLYDALHVAGNPANALVANAIEKSNNGTYIPLEAGKNYVFTFTIGKTKIKDITAQVAQWENVEAEPFNPTNARIKLQLEERGTPVTAPVDIYRAADNASTVTDSWESYKWTTGYVGNKNVFREISGTWKLENDWFWNNNKNYYHFRAIMPSGQTVNTDSAPDPDEDYVSLSSGESYTDILWGAPMRDATNNEVPDDFKFIYDKDNGFDVKNSDVDASKSQIYQAIGPTEDKLKLTLFHMMSDLTIKIKTTTGADKVELCHDNGNSTYNRTRLDLVGFYNGGKVLLGTGLVKTDGSASTTSSPVNIPFKSATDNTSYVQQVYTFGAVPQDLDNVQLVITTPDHNQYIVDLDKVKVTASSISPANVKYDYPAVDGENGKCYIDRWIPNTMYTYSFTLAKTGITNLQATIVDWETVTADDETVKIQ